MLEKEEEIKLLWLALKSAVNEKHINRAEKYLELIKKKQADIKRKILE